MSRIRRVLHPTDFSRASAAAFSRAVETAKSNRAELLLVNVITPTIPPVGDGYISPKWYAEMEASARAYAQKHLTALLAKAKRAGVRAKGLLMEGPPHQRIAQAARRKRADLVVIGTHGRTGFARFFLGSVASRVLAIAPCPVLTVRGK
jgi:nucleotide-binding universal stress UspA family protein